MITTNANAIQFSGPLDIGDFHYLLATIHDRVEKRGYQDVVLDFSDCTATFGAGPMSAICAQVCNFRRQSIDFKLILPKHETLARLFNNTNWANLIDPSYEKSNFRGLLQVPITQFFITEEQTASVNAILDVVLGSLTGFTRSDLAAIEWSLNEITDNVINHAQSEVGGLLQLSTFKRNQKRVEYVVCDAGIGIPESLRSGLSNITSDSQALDFAIREGFTRNKASNQGNGLFGAFEISRVSEGYMQIHSGYASLQYHKKAGLHIRTEQIPFKGTLIVSGIDYSNPGLLGEALKFGGKQHLPVDFIETKFEDPSGNKVVFSMKNEASSFGSRKAAEPVSTKLINLAALSENYKVFIDFLDVTVISSSFADEVFGKLFVSMGPLAFIQKFEFMNLNDTVRSLIDRAITLRSSTKIN